MSTKRDQIMLATRDLILEVGLQDTSMSQIAQRADVGMGTIYNYFSSKEELVYSLYSAIKIDMGAYVLEGYDKGQPVVVRFLRLLTLIARFGVQYPREFRLVEQLAKVPFIQEQANVMEQPLIVVMDELFVEAQSQHLLKELPSMVIGLMIFGALNALVEAHATGEMRLDEALIEQVVSACWDAIKR